MGENSNLRTPFNQDISGFYGIGEGTQITARANADAARASDERLRLLVQNLVDKSGGYNAEKAKSNVESAAIQEKSMQSKNTMYIAIGVVAVLMVGLYLVVGAKKR